MQAVSGLDSRQGEAGFGAPVDNRGDDIRGEQGQRQGAADVAAVDIVANGQLQHRCSLAGLKIREPFSGRCDGLNQVFVRLKGHGAVPTDDQLGFNPPALERDGRINHNL